MKESQFHCNSVIIPVSRVIIPGAYKRRSYSSFIV